MTGNRKKRRAAQDEAPVLELGGLRFSRERIEQTHDGKRMVAFGRDGTRWIRLARDSASEQPLTEFLWAVGAGGGSYFLFTAYAPGKTGALIGALALAAVALALIVHMLRRVPTLTIQGRDGSVTFQLDKHISTDDLEKLARRLRDELGWPVQGSGAGEEPGHTSRK